MLVCHCHALTDRDIRRTVRLTGACSVAEVGDHCGAATGCGGCHELVDEIVACEKRRLVVLNALETREGSNSGLEQGLPQQSLALTG